MRKKVRWLLYPLHLGYWVLFVVSMTNDLGAICTSTKVLPAIFFIKDACFLVYFAVLLCMSQNKFLIDWNNAGQRQLKLRDLNRKKSDVASEQNNLDMAQASPKS